MNHLKRMELVDLFFNIFKDEIEPNILNFYYNWDFSRTYACCDLEVSICNLEEINDDDSITTDEFSKIEIRKFIPNKHAIYDSDSPTEFSLSFLIKKIADEKFLNNTITYLKHNLDLEY